MSPQTIVQLCAETSLLLKKRGGAGRSIFERAAPNGKMHAVAIAIAAADILIEIYMAESAILRTEKNVKRTNQEEQSAQIAMAKLYLYHAVDTVEQKGKESIISFAEGDEQRMMLMGLKRFTKYTNYPDIVDLRIEIAEKVKEENSYCF
jgi:tryptophan synthase beta subunit